MEILIVIIVWAALMVAIIITYNNLLSKKNQVSNALGSVNAMLKKRYDLLPNLVSIVRVYMLQEKDMLDEITSLADKANTDGMEEEEKTNIDSQIRVKMTALLVKAEDSHALRSNEQFSRLQGAWNEAEEQIAATRRAYNESVTEYNNAIEGFPGNMFAKNMKLQPKEVFDISEEEKENVKADELLASADK